MSRKTDHFFVRKLICAGGRVISNREMPIGEGEMRSFQLHRVVSRVQEEGRLVAYRKESTCVEHTPSLSSILSLASD